MIITVVTPTLNGAAFLPACIESVKRNHDPSFKVDHVIVDAGSTDRTVEIARESGLRILQGKDQGIFDAINKGSFNSQGDLLGFLGADDVMLDGALLAIADAYRRKRPDWIVGGSVWTDDRDRHLGTLAAPPNWMTASILACLGWNPIMHMSTYFSRDFFLSLGGFDISFRNSGDYEMFTRALAQRPYCRIRQPLACFRRTRVNNSVLNYDRARSESKRILDQLGPTSPVVRRIMKGSLKLWINLRNPIWAAKKFVVRIKGRANDQPIPVAAAATSRPGGGRT